MNYADIKSKDVANGQGFGVSLFVSGCTHHCKGCFNSCTWDFSYGEMFTNKELDLILSYLDRPYVDFFAVLGGEPFEKGNRVTVFNILKEVRRNFPRLCINIWSGYTYEELLAFDDDSVTGILNICNYLVDGEFKEELKDLSLKMRGSSNQRVIDLGKTLSSGSIVLVEDLM